MVGLLTALSKAQLSEGGVVPVRQLPADQRSAVGDSLKASGFVRQAGDRALGNAFLSVHARMNLVNGDKSIQVEWFEPLSEGDAQKLATPAGNGQPTQTQPPKSAFTANSGYLT